MWCEFLELTKVDFLFSSIDIHSFGIQWLRQTCAKQTFLALIQEFLTPSWKFLTPALLVVLVTNIRYGFNGGSVHDATSLVPDLISLFARAQPQMLLTALRYSNLSSVILYRCDLTSIAWVRAKHIWSGQPPLYIPRFAWILCLWFWMNIVSRGRQ